MQMDKKINGQRGSRQTNKQRVMQMDKKINGQTDKQTNRQPDKQTTRQTDKLTVKQLDKRTNRKNKIDKRINIQLCKWAKK